MSARTITLRALAAGPLALALGCTGAAPGEPTSSTFEAVQVCPSSTVEGIDIYDGTGSVAWASVKSAGVDFAMIKATQGTYDTQSSFATNWSGAKAAGLLRSAYHFFDPTEDGVAQAQHYLSVVGSLAADDLPAMLDIECPDGDPNCMYTGGSGQAAASTIHQRMWDWIHTVEQATGKPPIVYTYGSYFSSNGIDTTGLAAYPLFLGDPSTASCFDVPSPWSSAAIWQYSWTGTVSGISGQVDRDRFLGTLSDLQAFARRGALPSQVNGNDALTVVNWPSDGHVEVFVTTDQGVAEHVYTQGLSDTWTHAYAFQGTAACGVASVMWPTSSHGAYAELFAPGRGAGPGTDAGTGAATEHLWWTGSGWNTFADFGTGGGRSHLSTVVAADGHVEVFGLAADGSIEHDVWDPAKGAWAGWASLGGQLVTGAAPIAWLDGHVEVFATDAHGGAWHDWTKQGAWQGWSAMTGVALASRPVPVRWPDGHVEVFARGADGHAAQASSTSGGWTAFAALDTATEVAGEVSALVAPSSGGAGARADLFARTPSGQVVHASWGGSASTWVGWTPLGTQVVASDPLGWVRPDGAVEVFAVDASGTLVKNARGGDAGTWGGWASLATGIDPCATSAAVVVADGGTGTSGSSAPADAGADDGRALGDAAAFTFDAGPDARPDGAAGPSGHGPNGEDSGGCACRAAGAERLPGGQAAFVAFALAMSLVARRRGSKASRPD